MIVGLYDPGPAPPAWASFGMLADFGDFAEARRLSERRGFRWVLQLGFAEPIERPIEAHATKIKARLDAAGLTPYVIALAVREEWYEHWRAGAYTALGLPPGHEGGVAIIRDWAGRQHQAAKAVLGLPVVWITTGPNDNPVVGPHQPVPRHVDVVAVDAYVPAGGTFATHVAPVLRYAETATALPLVLIAQWFRHEGDPLWHDGPSAEDVAAYFAWARRPRWLALLGFTWRSRGNGIVGACDLPVVRAVIDQHLEALA